jgi:hypothetical protein
MLFVIAVRVIAVRGVRQLNRGCFYFFHSIVLLVFPDCQ